MTEQAAFSPAYRVVVAISAANDEILVAAMRKSYLSPYLEPEAGYSWDDDAAVAALPFKGPSETLGYILRGMIAVSLCQWSAAGAKDALRLAKAREKYLRRRFGEDKLRFRFGPTSLYRASTAPRYKTFLETYIHVVVEDDGGGSLRFCLSTDIRKPELTPAQTGFPLASNDHALGQAVLVWHAWAVQAQPPTTE